MNEQDTRDPREGEQATASKASLKTIFRIEKERYHWIDQGRGMVMFLLVLSGLMPEVLRSAHSLGISNCIFKH